MAHKTNSMRMLDQRGIAYKAYQFPEDVHSAEGVAEVLQVPPGQVYKTLVVMRQRGKPLLVLVPGDQALDLKQLARASGEKKLRMVTYKEAEDLTGLQVGGISALPLLHKGFDVFVDQSILSWPEVYISPGRRGLNISLDPRDLLWVIDAQPAHLTCIDDEGVT